MKEETIKDLEYYDNFFSRISELIEHEIKFFTKLDFRDKIMIDFEKLFENEIKFEETEISSIMKNKNEFNNKIKIKLNLN